MRPLNQWIDEMLATSAAARLARSKTPLMGENRFGYSEMRAERLTGPDSVRTSGEEPMHGNKTDTEGAQGSPVRSNLPGSSGAETTESTARAERLAAIRARIEAGVYDTPERLEAAVERLARVLSREI